jgi:hypothetical protein
MSIERAELQVGDHVAVDLTGLYQAICGRCGGVTLLVPEGCCVHCKAPEDQSIPGASSWLDGPQPVWGNLDGVAPTESDTHLYGDGARCDGDDDAASGDTATD